MSEFKQKLRKLAKRIENEKMTAAAGRIKPAFSQKILVFTAALAWFLLFLALVFKG